jgi:cytochrome c oxidase subunit III
LIAIVLFMIVVAAVAGWWLSRQGLMAKPWLEQGLPRDVPPVSDATTPLTAKIGLGVFLCVVSSLFALLISAYSMRMQGADWRPLPIPILLWINTGLLVLSSIALEWARAAAPRSEIVDVRAGLVLGGVSALAFLLGQLMAWRQLDAAGYFMATNPANSFFYLITAVHGLHVLGGLVALGRTGALALVDPPPKQLRANVELCAIYWHFLLVVWLILLALLAGWAGDFLAICRQVLT